jgi:hypothetical protein
MRKRKLAGKVTGELRLPVLLYRLELALAGIPDRTSVCEALPNLDKHLSSVGEKCPARTC